MIEDRLSDLRPLKSGLTVALCRAARAFAGMTTMIASILAVLCWYAPERMTCLSLCAVAVALACGAAIGGQRGLASPSRKSGMKAAAHLVALGVGTALALATLLAFAAVPPSGRLVAVATAALTLASSFVLVPSVSCAALFLLPMAAGTGFGLSRWTEVPVGTAWGAPLTATVLALLGGFLFHLSLRRSIVRDARMTEQSSVLALLEDTSGKTRSSLWQTDMRGALVDVGDRCAAILGVAMQDLEGRDLVQVLGRPADPVSSAMKARRAFSDVLVEAIAAGRAWRLSGMPLIDDAGRFTGFRGLIADVGEDRLAQSPLAPSAEHDMLTALPNRRSLEVCMEAGVALSQQDHKVRSLLFIDLDGFKMINDGFGHAAGDAVLKAVVDRWRPAVPKGALLARFGGDEFALFYAPTERANAVTLATTLIGLLKAPFAIEGAQMTLGASIGIAHAPDHGDSVAELERRADLALYSAKAIGKGRVFVFSDEIEAKVTARRHMEADLKLALVRDEFKVEYQPLFDLTTADIVGFEALLRWETPSRGSVSPSDFIPIAERIGIIDIIGRWVLERACKAAVEWPGEQRVAVNISPGHFCSPGFLGDVRKALQASGLPPSRLEIEITEGALLDQSRVALETINALRERGTRIALDDFGTGYSSMNYLVRFPVDKIKIDRSFITNYLERSENRAIVDSMIALARKLSIRVTAEGVETLEQALALKLRRCDDIQGFLISPSQPEREVVALAASLPRKLRARYTTLFESRLAAVLAMKKSA